MDQVKRKKMTEEKRQQIERKKRKKRRRRVALLVIELVILCVLGISAYGMLKLGKLNQTTLDEEKIVNNGLEQEGYTNVALFGTDNRKGETSGVRSDCIIVASINNKTKEVKLLSVFRDTMLQLEDGTYNKANAAYAVGGPEAAINMLNKNLDLDISDYASVNFLSLADVVDLLGGIEIEMSYEEVCHMNNYCVETSQITGKDYNPIDPEEAGTYQLNGVQAVSYARIRYTAGGDFDRASRQRLVIEKIGDKAKHAKLGTLNKIIDTVLPEISTSFSSGEIIKMASAVLEYQIGESAGFPFNPETPESVPGYQGSYVVAAGLADNVKQAHQFLFPEQSYEPTETVSSISDELIYITGIQPLGTQTGEDTGDASDGDYQGE